VVEPLDAADRTDSTPVPEGPRLVDAEPLDVCDARPPEGLTPLEGLTGTRDGAGDWMFELAKVVLRPLGSTVTGRDDGRWEIPGAAEGTADEKAEDPFETVGERAGPVVGIFDDTLEGCEGGRPTLSDVGTVGVLDDAADV
jgi:hypothetical protein